MIMVSKGEAPSFLSQPARVQKMAPCDFQDTPIRYSHLLVIFQLEAFQ
jgi:hypothetical protein